jgi:nicotinamide mononucleotide adenylyltransferase
MQAPVKEIRQQYLKENDIQILLTNSGRNLKDEKGYNKNFFADYSDVEETYEFTEFTPQDFYERFFPKVLVIARFQGMHKGHKIVIEEAKRLSPNITIGLRVDDGDLLDLHENIEAIKRIYPNFNYVQTPDLKDPRKKWVDFVKEYDIVVQGNPEVIYKFQPAIDRNEIKLHHVPRIGHVSATKIREAVKRGDLDYAKMNVADPKILDFLQKEIKEEDGKKR